MSAPIVSSKKQPQSLLLTAVGLVLTSASHLSAAQEVMSAVELSSQTVVGETPAYRSTHSVSVKNTAPLFDTPQTIQVIPAEVIKEQQALSLRQVLSNVSGITFNAGEGGGGSGDSVNIRGFSANANMQIDGLRDSTQTNRTDTFNIEAVEVIKGPNSVFGGSGTTGGSVNQASKEPMLRDFTELGASLGTDGYHRMTLDTNQTLERLGSGSAFRLNLMAHENDVPGRDDIDRKRWGIAPSVLFGLSDTARLTLSYFHQVDDNLPDYGVPARDGKKLAGVSRDDYFGFRNFDKEEITSDAFTIKFEHDINEALQVQNLTRYSRIDRDTIISAAHVNVAGLPAGRYKPAGPQGYGRDVESQMWINQLSLIGENDFLGMQHSWVVGGEVSRETYDREAYNHAFDFTGIDYDLYNPPSYYAGAAQRTSLDNTKTHLTNKAVYAFDTISLTPKWDINLGLRYDWLNGDYEKTTLATATKAEKYENYRTEDKKFSGRVGLVYKPADNGRIYVAYGTSFNPSAEFLTTMASGVSGATADLSPEKNRSLELGAKWIFFNSALELDGAIYHVEKTNAREQLADGSYVLAGEQRVQGVELGATGKVTDAWKVYANYTYMSSETTKSSDAKKKGQALANTPPHSFNLWTTYDLPQGWQVGYGSRYVSQRNVTSDTKAKLAEYWVHNALVAYQVNDQLNVQLNMNNIFDKDYVERVRQRPGDDSRSSAVEFGDGRNVVLSTTYKF
ncbi:TonB-dependent siderophore receptor [Denitrificimonas sp. JX-1]|uniref:TonB-dependent siderophore receptor n=1 Tax=Denitrificimonas halotolerans TaxID=3098930 RepID=A0ABU5GS33_9GAMM|nr:TonB-dependent siderophore receptor [Denitrificimonas sp. JX-1]MDY7219783.1 TonB-dependent siderophore receptor [Denitrificimonas sp. JX-1]